jgi:hypothetical protein
MVESSVVAEWIARGMIKGRRETVLRVLQLRFSEQAAAEAAATVEAQTDLDLLARWLDAAVLTPSWEEFRATAQIGSNFP